MNTLSSAWAEPVVYLPTSSKFDLETFKTRFRGYNKLLSMLYLRAIGLPILDGLVVETWSDAAGDAIRRFCAQRGWDKVLLRHDKRPEIYRSPRGGYVFALSRLREELTEFFEQDRIVVLLEPCSPYGDLYSLNVMFRETEPTFLIEIVGPGFDASDLQRGDITPHQYLVIRRNLLDDAELDRSRFTVEQKIMSTSAYRRTVHERLMKIAKAHAAPLEENSAKECLIERGDTLLLEHLDDYRPIPAEYLEFALSLLAGLPPRLGEVSGNRGTFVVSMSFLAPSARLVCWDVVWPHLKYATP